MTEIKWWWAGVSFEIKMIVIFVIGILAVGGGAWWLADTLIDREQQHCAQVAPGSERLQTGRAGGYVCLLPDGRVVKP